jgi:hypothetical protein
MMMTSSWNSGEWFHDGLSLGKYMK